VFRLSTIVHVPSKSALGPSRDWLGLPETAAAAAPQGQSWGNFLLKRSRRDTPSVVAFAPFAVAALSSS